MEKIKFYPILKEASKKKNKLLAVLIDPDKIDEAVIKNILDQKNIDKVSCFLVGGSLLTSGDLDQTISLLKKYFTIPILLFPGSPSQISLNADGILFLSLISGRNPESLIGQQIIAAPFLKRSKLEVISTGYMLIDSGCQTTASYISNTTPIPSDKPEIAVSTAIAGELLGMSLIYMDAGSGAKNPISKEMISNVKQNLDIPLIVGGGINSTEKMKNALDAGADLIVIGNAFEENPNFLSDATQLISSYNK